MEVSIPMSRTEDCCDIANGYRIFNVFRVFSVLNYTCAGSSRTSDALSTKCQSNYAKITNRLNYSVIAVKSPKTEREETIVDILISSQLFPVVVIRSRRSDNRRGVLHACSLFNDANFASK